MSYQFYLNGVLIDMPLGFESLSTTITRNEERGVTQEETAELTFIGDGYNALYELSLSNYCGVLPVKILEYCGGGYMEYLNGVILITDCEFNISKCICTATIKDNSYYSRIETNKSIGISPSIVKTKNDLDSDIIDIEFIEIFTPSTGAALGNARMYSVHSVMSKYISFMTDNEVEFRSDILLTGEFKGVMITSGLALATWNTIDDETFRLSFEKMDFQTFFKSISALLNLGWRIEYSGSTPVFRVEDSAFYYNEDISVEVDLSDDLGIVKSYFKEKIYAKVEVGSDTTEDNPTDLEFPEKIVFRGFYKEEYVILGECNTDTTLDLTSQLITSSNVIEGVTLGILTDYDNRWFIIDSDGTLATKTNWLENGQGLFYNELFNNSEVIRRHLGAIPTAIANYITDAEFLFLATLVFTYFIINSNPGAPVPFTFEPLPFTDDTPPEGNDVGNVWSVADYEFRAPLGGIYDFHVHFDFDMVPFLGFSTFQLIYKVYDEGGYTGGGLYATTSNAAFTPVVGNNVVDDYISVYLPAGYKMIVSLYTPYFDGNLNVQLPTLIECTDSTNGNGILETFDPLEYPVINYRFEQFITKAKEVTIKANTNKLIRVTDGKNLIKGWISEVKINAVTGQSIFSLISSNKIQ